MSVPDVVQQFEALPLVWLSWLRTRGQRRDEQWWWIAGAFFVSWIADTAARPFPAFLVSMVFPIIQATLVAAALLYDRADAVRFLWVLFAVGIAAMLINPYVDRPDVLLSSVAFLGVAGIAWDFKAAGRLRLALLWFFGAQLAYYPLAAWTYHCNGMFLCLTGATASTLWGAYHGAMVVGLLVFCWAANDPTPRFSLSRRAA